MNTCTLKNKKPEDKPVKFECRDSDFVIVFDQDGRRHETLSNEDFAKKYDIVPEDKPKG